MNAEQPRLHTIFPVAVVLTFSSAWMLDRALEHAIAAPFRILILGALTAVVGALVFRYAAAAQKRQPERYAMPRRAALLTVLWSSLVVFTALVRFYLTTWERM